MTNLRLYQVLLPVCVLLGMIVSVVAEVHAQSGRDREIVVTAGDNFSTLSLREFGSAAYAQMIAEYNGMAHSASLSAGDILRIPLESVSQINSAEVFFAKGEPVRYFAGAADQNDILNIGDQVFRRDIIRTLQSGFVSLRFPSGTAVNIQPNSVIQLTNLDCLERSLSCIVELSASQGAINSNVIQRGNQPTRMLIHTPHASAAVRGTVFDVDASDEQILVGVIEGEVDVSAQGRSTDLIQGLGVRTAAGQASEPPVKLLVAPSLRRMPPRVTTEDTLGWYSLPAAGDYLVALSRDAEGAATLYQNAQTTTRHQIQAVDPGDYYIVVRARDENGFRGFPNAELIQVASIDETVAAVPLQLVSDGDEQILSIADLPDGVLGAEIQLSFSRDFLELSGVDVPPDGGVVFVPAGLPQFARARVLIDETSTSVLGPVLELPVQ